MNRGRVGAADAVLKVARRDFAGGRLFLSRVTMRRGPQMHGIYGEGEGEVIRVEARQTKTLARSNCLTSAGTRGVAEVKRRAQ